MFEEVAFDSTRITSIDWSIYPILHFDAVPESLAVRIVDRPGTPFLGCGEAAQGPASAAIANATGQRIRDLPLNAGASQASDFRKLT
jgi:CO/xanthine dehydrogenase Mo-binding subunit